MRQCQWGVARTWTVHKFRVLCLKNYKEAILFKGKKCQLCKPFSLFFIFKSVIERYCKLYLFICLFMPWNKNLILHKPVYVSVFIFEITIYWCLYSILSYLKQTFDPRPDKFPILYLNLTTLLSFQRKISFFFQKKSEGVIYTLSHSFIAEAGSRS